MAIEKSELVLMEGETDLSQLFPLTEEDVGHSFKDFIQGDKDGTLLAANIYLLGITQKELFNWLDTTAQKMAIKNSTVANNFIKGFIIGWRSIRRAAVRTNTLLDEPVSQEDIASFLQGGLKFDSQIHFSPLETVARNAEIEAARRVHELQLFAPEESLRFMTDPLIQSPSPELVAVGNGARSAVGIYKNKAVIALNK